jgi:hypothetical protein
VSRYLRMLGVVLLGLAAWKGMDAASSSNPLRVLDGFGGLFCLLGALGLFWHAAKQPRQLAGSDTDGSSSPTLQRTGGSQGSPPAAERER